MIDCAAIGRGSICEEAVGQLEGAAGLVDDATMHTGEPLQPLWYRKALCSPVKVHAVKDGAPAAEREHAAGARIARPEATTADD